MGWLWASSTPTKEFTTPPPKDDPVDAPLDYAERPTPSIPETPSSTSASSGAAPAEAELQAFLESLSSKDTPPSSPPKSKYRTGLTSPLPPEPTTTPTDPSSSIPITPSLIYPSTISCRDAFDFAMWCRSPGGQFISVYRNGSWRSCSAYWSAFWFCMRTNRGYMSDEERARRVREHYWKRDEKYRQGPSSEDVWAAREELVRKDSGEGCFEGDWEALEREEKEKMMRAKVWERLKRKATQRNLYGGLSDAGG